MSVNRRYWPWRQYFPYDGTGFHVVGNGIVRVKLRDGTYEYLDAAQVRDRIMQGHRRGVPTSSLYREMLDHFVQYERQWPQARSVHAE